jgi:HSP20 family protein
MSRGACSTSCTGSSIACSTASSTATRQLLPPPTDWIPQADIEEYADRFVLKLDVPGVDVAAIEITLDKGVLSLSGERVQGRGGQGRAAQPHRALARPLPPPLHAARHVDAAGVHATGRNGIVEVTIPKQPKAQPRRIQVATA